MVDLAQHLRTRRSPRLIDLGAPVPSAGERDAMLTLAARTPDHGKLAPWRFIVFEGAAREAAGKTCAEVLRAGNPQATADTLAQEAQRFCRAPLVVAVVSRAAPHVKIPEREQLLSAAAVTMNLVHAAYALGFAATWVTEWIAYDPACLRALGLADHETLVGFVYIGTPKLVLEERPRPPLTDIVTMFGS